MGELIFIGVLLQNYLAALLVSYYCRSLDEFLIPVGPLFQEQYGFLQLCKPIGGPQRNEEIFVRPSNTYCLFTETSWSELENLLKYSSIGF